MDKFYNYYGDFSIDKSENPSFEKSSERVNLLLGLPQKIKHYERLANDRMTDWFNSPVSSPELTDGKFAALPQCFDPAWFHFTDGTSRSIMYDLGGLCAVDGVRAGVLKEDSTAVWAPVRISVLLSENGEDWQTVCELSGFDCEESSAIIRKEAKFDKSYKARYVKFTFCIVCHVFIDELELFGCRDGEGAAEIVADKASFTDFPDKYATAEQLGAKDVLLAYVTPDGIPPISKEIFLPHVAYMKDGQIKDTLFDSFLFLPYVRFLYDGYNKRPLQMKDWQSYVDCQFDEGVNLDALEQSAIETGKALGNPDYTVSVFFSILYPVTSVEDFGTIDGRKLNFANLEDRKTALKWLIDIQVEKFKAKNYKHIKLNGFYWFTEEINYGDEQLLELLRYTTDYVRSLGYITTWIPYFHASGFNDWRHLGFDMACYQPNYAFNQSVPDGRLFDAASTAKLLGMCIELEIGGTESWNIERIKKYYAAGALTGYMKDAAHMYYQGGVPGEYYKAYKSQDPVLRSVYDDTYKFIKGTFDPSGIDFD